MRSFVRSSARVDRPCAPNPRRLQLQGQHLVRATRRVPDEGRLQPLDAEKAYEAGEEEGQVAAGEVSTRVICGFYEIGILSLMSAH